MNHHSIGSIIIPPSDVDAIWEEADQAQLNEESRLVEAAHSEDETLGTARHLDRQKRDRSNFTLFSIGGLYFPTTFHSILLTNIIAPLQVLDYTGQASKGVGLGIVVGATNFAGLIAAPTIGFLSDRSRLKLGRRRPFMIAGVILDTLALIALMIAPTQLLYTLATLFDNILLYFIYAPMVALIPDLIKVQQNGAASGWGQASITVGSILACIVGLFAVSFPPMFKQTYYFWSYAMTIMLTWLFLPLLYFVKENQLRFRGHLSLKAPTVKKKVLTWLLNKNFLMISCSMALQYTSQGIVQNFYQYYYIDRVKQPNTVIGLYTVTNSATATSLFTIVIFFGSVLSSLPSGTLSDKFGRKFLTVLSLVLQIGPTIGLIFSQNFNISLLMGFIYGIGNAAWQTISFAILTDVLPDFNANTRTLYNGLILGVNSAIQSAPLTFTPLLNGYLIDKFPGFWGYVCLYGLSMLYLTISMILIFLIKVPTVKVEVETRSLSIQDDEEDVQ